MKNRTLILYTTDYLIKPFKVVYDESKSKESPDKVEIKLNQQRASNNGHHYLRVLANVKIKNSEVTKFYNSIMEIPTIQNLRLMDKTLKRNQLVHKFIKEYHEIIK